ncbi:hypothetical protein D3C86_1573050 [compost metagenome]
MGLAVEGDLDRAGVEGGAVVEAHALSQVEGVGLAVGRNVPAGGERRLDLGRVLLEAHQAVEEVLGDGGALGLVDVRRIEAGGVLALGVDQDPAVARLFRARGGLGGRAAPEGHEKAEGQGEKG